MDTEFWTRLDEMIRASNIVIDRPKGCARPELVEGRTQLTVPQGGHE